MLLRLTLALLPLLLTVLFGWLTMEGHLNFGGGEKDIFLLIPLILWSLLFGIAVLVFSLRRAGLSRTLGLSAALATGLLVLIWSALFMILLARQA